MGPTPCEGCDYVDGYGWMGPWRKPGPWVPWFRRTLGRTVCAVIGHDEEHAHPRSVSCNRCWANRVKV